MSKVEEKNCDRISIIGIINKCLSENTYNPLCKPLAFDVEIEVNCISKHKLEVYVTLSRTGTIYLNFSIYKQVKRDEYGKSSHLIYRIKSTFMRSIRTTKKEFIIILIILVLLILLDAQLKTSQQVIDDFLYKQLLFQKLNSPIKIIYFDDYAIEQLHGWPISRNVYSYLIHILNQLQVATIGVDIFFPPTSPLPDEDDLLLVETNKKFDNIVNSYYFQHSSHEFVQEIPLIRSLDFESHHFNSITHIQLRLPFPELLKANPEIGFANVNIDKKGMVRTSALAIRIRNKLYPSFSLAVAMNYLRQKYPTKNPMSLLKEFDSPLKENYIIHYAVEPEQLELFPAIDLMQAFQKHATGLKVDFDLAQFRDSIVLIAALSENLGSYKPTPVSANYPVAGIHAQIIDNILSNNFLNHCSKLVEILILLILILIFFQLRRVRILQSFLIIIISGLLITTGYVFFFRNNIILPIASIYLLLALMMTMVIISHYRAQKEQFLKGLKDESALEQELNEKIAMLSQLENRLHQVQNSEMKVLHEKMASYRTQIKRLKDQIRDMTIPGTKEPAIDELQHIFPEIIFSNSSPIREVLQTTRKVAQSDSTVLLTGESGTGKELIARAIHRLSARKDAPFVVVNCAALAESLIESELFGHKKGAFTGAIENKKGIFEAADGGTIFLDEISETSLLFQAKLLRVVQEKELYPVGSEKSCKTDVRIITATNRDIKTAIASSEFREDLFYRLSVITIEIPPLRDRKSDIPLLVQHFLRNKSKQFSQAATDVLKNYHWPGNVRELQNLVQRCVIMNEEQVISANWLQNQFGANQPPIHKTDDLAEMILNKLRQKEFKFNTISEIAEELGHIHRSTITEHLKGIIFKAFYETHFSLAQTIRYLNPDNNESHDQRLKNRIVHYLRNLQNSVSFELSFEENLIRLKSRFKNLPQRYHFYLEEIIRKVLDGSLKIR